MAGECPTTKQITHQPSTARATGLPARAVGFVIITQTKKQNKIGGKNYVMEQKIIWSLSKFLIAIKNEL
jgi:hypothetical protein